MVCVVVVTGTGSRTQCTERTTSGVYEPLLLGTVGGCAYESFYCFVGLTFVLSYNSDKKSGKTGSLYDWVPLTESIVVDLNPVSYYHFIYDEEAWIHILVGPVPKISRPPSGLDLV